MSPPDIWYMKDLEVVDRLSSDALRRLRDAGRIERWGHRAEISRRGDPGELSLVLKGTVYLDADEFAPGPVRLSTGDIFGDLDTDFSVADVRLHAFDDTMIVGVPRPIFEEVTGGELGGLTTTAGSIFARTELEVPVSTLLFTEPQRRLAKVILHLTEEHGGIEADEGMLPVSVSGKHLARLAGLEPAHAREILDELRRDRVVEVAGRKLLIPSVARIEALSLQSK